jgi:hypothetical protein
MCAWVVRNEGQGSCPLDQLEFHMLELWVGVVRQHQRRTVDNAPRPRPPYVLSWQGPRF